MSTRWYSIAEYHLLKQVYWTISDHDLIEIENSQDFVLNGTGELVIATHKPVGAKVETYDTKSLFLENTLHSYDNLTIVLVEGTVNTIKGTSTTENYDTAFRWSGVPSDRKNYGLLLDFSTTPMLTSLRSLNSIRQLPQILPYTQNGPSPLALRQRS